MISFWEYDALLHTDIAVIGGGFTGAQAALSLRARLPHARIMVLERGLYGQGASTRNAGFACFGSPSELLATARRLGPEGMVDLVDERRRGLQILRSRVPDAAMDYTDDGGHELFFDEAPEALDRLDDLNALLQPVFGAPPFRLADDKAKLFGGVRHVAFTPFEGQLQPARAIDALHRLARAQGIDVHYGCRVANYEENADGVRLRLDAPEPLIIRAARVVLCTNAFTSTLTPQPEVTPGRGLVLLTAPLARAPFAGSHHFDEGFYYFRNVGKRVLLGGGRNLDVAGETTTAFGVNPAIETDLHRRLRDVVLPGQAHEVEFTWSGVMAFGGDGRPAVEAISARVCAGVRLQGMGVALGARIGEQLAELVAQS